MKSIFYDGLVISSIGVLAQKLLYYLFRILFL